MAFDITDQDGWHYAGRVEVESSLKVRATKDISDSPPGKARYFVNVAGELTDPPDVEVDNVGRPNGPRLQVNLTALWALADDGENHAMDANRCSTQSDLALFGVPDVVLICDGPATLNGLRLDEAVVDARVAYFNALTDPIYQLGFIYTDYDRGFDKSCLVLVEPGPKLRVLRDDKLNLDCTNATFSIES